MVLRRLTLVSNLQFCLVWAANYGSGTLGSSYILAEIT